jgi:glycosyltransferase involved in cell wall biosynthesis
MKFSVLICVYGKDSPHLFKNALASIFANTCKPDEVILVVDGPIPEEVNKIIDFYIAQPELRVLFLKENLGFTAALNQGLQLVKNDWVIRADSDDENLPDRFDKLMDRAIKNDVGLIGSSIVEVNEDGEIYSEKKMPAEFDEIKKYMIKRNPFNHMSVAFKTKVVKGLGGYPDIPLREDYGLWIKVISNGIKAVNIDEILVKASAGKAMFERRGGLKTFKYEFILQRTLYKAKISKFYQAIFYWFLRSIVLSLPPNIVGLFYLNFLRNKKI